MKKVAFTILVSIIMIFISPSLIWSQSSDLLIKLEQEPLFNEINIVPGDFITRTITVTNLSQTDTYLFGIATYDEIDNEDLATQLKLEIFDDDDNIVYGKASDPKTLADLFAESEFSEIEGKGYEINLVTLSPEETQEIKMKVSFPTSAGNEWQNKETIFSFGLGWVGEALDGDIAGEDTKSQISKVLGTVLSKTGQNILIGLIIGGGLILISKKLITKKA